MATSYNGWPASPSPDAIGVNQNFVCLGQKFPAGVKSGDVETVFTALIEFLNTIERIVPGWNWGYYYRQTTGGTTLSCHASATGIDYNAPNHPYGQRGTWSAEEIRKIDAFLDEVLEGVVFWGEHYRNNCDGMHFEINASAAEVARIAAELRGKPMEDQLSKEERAAVGRIVDRKIDAALRDVFREAPEEIKVEMVGKDDTWSLGRAISVLLRRDAKHTETIKNLRQRVAELEKRP